MADRIRWKLEGFKELENTLRQLSKAVGSRKVREALEVASLEVADRFEADAWRDTGQTAESMAVETQRTKGGVVRVDVGPSKEREHIARFNEFGTARQGPRPRLRPAFAKAGPDAMKIFAGSLKVLLARTARRYAKLR